VQVSADAVAEERDRQASGLVGLLPVELNVINCHLQPVGQGFQGLYIAVVKGVRFHPFDVYKSKTCSLPVTGTARLEQAASPSTRA